MIQRMVNPLSTRSFFLFGPRGVGKTSLLKQLFPPDKNVWINLLDVRLFQELTAKPERFLDLLPSKASPNLWVVADEIQKIPALLDYIHLAIEERKIKFALTGSSARKLKKGGANLLAGRALVNHLHPLTYSEAKSQLSFSEILKWGALPGLLELNSDLEKSEFLKAYTGTYLREEIKEEQIVRQLDPFARFLEAAAQANSKILNFAKISNHSLADTKSVQRYFDILVDTFLGFYLEPYHTSIRKVQTAKSKFYFFDIGVKKALAGTLGTPITPGSYSFGEDFEHFFVLECIRLKDYHRSSDRFYYLRTKDDLEIDLIIERNRKEVWALEIKSADRVDDLSVRKFKKIADDLNPKRMIVVSREKKSRIAEHVEILPWEEVLKELYP